MPSADAVARKAEPKRREFGASSVSGSCRQDPRAAREAVRRYPGRSPLAL